MKKINLIMKTIIAGAVSIAASGYINAQNLNSTNGGYAKTRIIDGKKFRVMYYEYEVKKTVQEVWNEISGNYIHVGAIHQSINESHCLSGDTTEGVGASRFCSFNFNGKNLDLKETIIEMKDGEKRKEFTYKVLAPDFPATVYNIWVVRLGDDGKTYLGNAFIFRAKPAIMTGIMAMKLKKLNPPKSGVLGYIYYMETGIKKADMEVIYKKYPESNN